MEGSPDEENIEKEEALEALRAWGPEDPRTQEIVLRWTEQQEAVVKRERTRRIQITFELDRAELYVTAGDPTEALVTLLWAGYRLSGNAESEYTLSDERASDDLAVEIERKIAQIASGCDPEVLAEARRQVENEVARTVTSGEASEKPASS
ncbi:MAG TPA: hypothetical protein VJ837_02915 [Candidatus Paceibacterota bacterium]|nr:hypothetical protein [Candidatus Paceibacterota bacterium]